MGKDKKQKKSAKELAADAAVDGFRLMLAKDAEPLRFVSTGVRAIDRICGGGLPRGRIIEVYGPYSSGKTLICQSLVVQVQAVGGESVYIDREHALDMRFAERTGINLGRMYYERKKKTVEDIFDYLMQSLEVLRKKHPEKLIAAFVDSIAAANTRKELERKDKMADQSALPLWDRDMGNRAKIIGEGLRKLSGVMDENMLVVIVNQTRSKVGVVYGNPEVTTGGQSLPFYASIRLRFQMGVYKDSKHEKMVMDGKRIIGTRCMVMCTKNKVSPPFRKCEAVQSFEYGFLEWPGLYELLFAEGVIAEGEKKGSFRLEGKEYKKEDFVDLVRGRPELIAGDPVLAPEASDVDADEVEAATAGPEDA